MSDDLKARLVEGIEIIRSTEPRFLNRDNIAAKYEAALARINELEATVTWRPIEEAPKDESEIIAWNGSFVVAADCIRGDEWTYSGGCSECRDGIYPQPTHFMPLPNPPQEGE